jgi:plasmid stabilization system protein ParE
MAEVIWTEQALEDFEQILDFIVQNSSETHARKLKDRIDQRVRILEKFPRLGRRVPETDEERYHELFEKPYRIVYELIDEDIVLIQHVVHSSRDMNNLLD